MYKKFMTVAVLAIVAVMMFGVIGTAAAFGGPRGENGPRELTEEQVTAIAEAFGITVEAFEAYREEGLNLREIAEALDIDLTDLELPFAADRAERRAERAAAIAEALGITVEALEAYHEEGLTLPEIADELGIDLSELELPERPGRRGPGGRGAGERGFGGPNGEAPQDAPADATPGAQA